MQVSAQDYYIPRYLDLPQRFILWTWDEWLLAGLPLGVLYGLSNQLLLGMGAGLLALFSLKKLKGEGGIDGLKRLLYWHLPALVHWRQTPASYIRTYMG